MIVEFDIDKQRMKKINLFTIIIAVLTMALSIIGCGDKREPGRIYMPDMAYSRSYQTYSTNDLKDSGINYQNYPVDGTIRRGDLFPYTGTNDSNGYKMSGEFKDPLPPIDSLNMMEAHRLFNVNCAICHGPNMDAQGPLATSGKIGGIANLKLDQYLKMPEGTMFHSVTYGKGNMGSYASQLSRKQRWMVIQYIKSEQAKAIASKAPTDSASIVKK